MPRPPLSERTDTRTQIQTVALELFIERGYEATSLREIAERLGVTKAALYYHFRTKDDIVASLFEDHLAQLDALLTWAETQPRNAETRVEFVRRYAEMLHNDRRFQLVQFLERNQPSLHKQRVGTPIRDRMVRIQGVLSRPDEPLPTRLRRSLAVVALHAGWVALQDPDVTDEQRRAAALEVALDLVA
jgi:AcrR family transcriptional regulator